MVSQSAEMTLFGTIPNLPVVDLDKGHVSALARRDGLRWQKDTVSG